MDNLEKANIIVEFVQRFHNDTQYDEFFAYNDLGIPLCVAITGELVTLTKKGDEILSDTWFSFCDTIGADPETDYDNLDTMLD